MSRRANVNVVALLVAGVLVWVALSATESRLPLLSHPRLVSAPLTGGASLTVMPAALPMASVPGAAQPGDVTVSATANGITIATRANALLSRPLRFSGRVPASSAGDQVVIERADRDGVWLPTASTIAGSGGTFTATWQTNHIGRFAIRAVVQGPGPTGDSPSMTITVYKPAIATLFGEGFYGSTTACGEVLGPGMLGVAHRWLKCGTPVAIFWNGHTIVVPVIDRGPYANNADWDLTEATGRRLGMYGTETIGAVALNR